MHVYAGDWRKSRGCATTTTDCHLVSRCLGPGSFKMKLSPILTNSMMGVAHPLLCIWPPHFRVLDSAKAHNSLVPTVNDRMSKYVFHS